MQCRDNRWRGTYTCCPRRSDPQQAACYFETAKSTARNGMARSRYQTSWPDVVANHCSQVINYHTQQLPIDFLHVSRSTHWPTQSVTAMHIPAGFTQVAHDNIHIHPRTQAKGRGLNRLCLYITIRKRPSIANTFLGSQERGMGGRSRAKLARGSG